MLFWPVLGVLHEGSERSFAGSVERDRGPQISSHLTQECHGLFHATTMQEQHRQFDTAVSVCKSLVRVVAGPAGEVDEHLFFAVGQLRIGRLHFNHQTPVNPPKANHDQR